MGYQEKKQEVFDIVARILHENGYPNGVDLRLLCNEILEDYPTVGVYFSKEKLVEIGLELMVA